MTTLQDILLNGTLQLSSALEIDFEQLQQLRTCNDVVNQRIALSSFVDQLCDAWTQIQSQCQTLVQSVYLSKSHLRLETTDERGAKLEIKLTDEELAAAPIEQLKFSRAGIQIRLEGFGEEFTPALAIIFTEKGIQIGYGINVFLCSNFTIRRADHLIRSGKNGSTEDLCTAARQWMRQTQADFEVAHAEIQALKNTEVDEAGWFEFIGRTYTQIQQMNHLRNHHQIKNVPNHLKDLPLTGAQLQKIVLESIRPAHEAYAFNSSVTNKWNLVNYGTETLKANYGNDFQTLLPTHLNWYELIRKHSFDHEATPSLLSALYNPN